MKLSEINFNGFHYSIGCNRFVLFDKHGHKLNEWQIDGLGDMEVLETKLSGYNNSRYFVGFPTLHVKLNYESKDKNAYSIFSLKFGDIEED